MPFTQEELQQMRSRRTFHSTSVQREEKPRAQESAPEGFLPKLLDFINKPSYASASFSNAITQGKTFEESVQAAGRGLIGEERYYYSDVLGNLGVQNKYLKAGGGFVLDVALDPLNAFSFFGKQGAKLGLTFLSSQGDDLLKAAMKQSSSLVKANMAAGMGKEAAELAAKEAIEQTVLRTALKDSGKYVAKKFQVKFLGQEIPVISGGLNDLATKFDKVTDPLYKAGPFKWLGENFVGEEFKIKHLKDLSKEGKNLLSLSTQQANRAILAGSQQAFDGALKLAEEVDSKKTREAIAHALEESFQEGAKPLKEILEARGIGEFYEQANKVEGLLGFVRDEKIRQGILSDAYSKKKIMPHYFEKHFKGAISQSIPNPIRAIDGHGNTRIFKTMEEAMDAGWQPIEDYAVSYGLSVAQSKKLIAIDNHTKRMVAEVGTPLRIGSQQWDEMIKTNRVPEGMGIYLMRGDARFAPMYNGKKTKAAQLRINKVMGDIMERHGRKAFAGGELVQDIKLTPFKNVIEKLKKGGKKAPEIPLYLMPREVADMLNQASPYKMTDKGMSELAKFSDDLLNVWKTSVTSLFPKFHMRNFASNIWNCALAGMGVGDTGRFQEAFKLQRYDDLLSKGKDVPDFIIKLEGKDYMASELIKIAKEEGVLGRGWFGREMAGTLQERLSRQVGVSDIAGLKGKEKAIAIAKGGIEKTRVVGNAVEDNARLGLFLDGLNKGRSFDDAAMRTKKFLFDYGDLTDFEKKTMKKLLPFYCVPDYSEILIKSGWKNVNDLKIGDMALTYNIEKDVMEWKPVLSIAIFKHNQLIRTWANKIHKLYFTHEHKWVVEKKKMKIVRPYGEYEYPKEISLLPSTKINTSHNIKVLSNYKGVSGGLSVQQAELLGWLLTDGSFRWKGNYCEAVIYQSPKKYLKDVKRVAGGKPRKPHPDSGVVCVPVLLERTEEIKDLLKRNKKKDNWIDVVTSLSKPALEAMYKAMMDADGHWGRKGDSFAAQLDGVAETFEVLATLLGKRVIRNSRGFNVSKRQTLGIKDGKFSEEKYNGRVWCPKTENNTWVMKQNNLITITGNTWTRKNLPLQIEQVIKNPTMFGRVQKAKGEIETLSDKPNDKYMPEWMKGKELHTRLPFKSNGKPTYTSFDMSFQDLAKLNLGKPVDVLRESLSMLRPDVKAFIEIALNYNTFYGRTMTDPDLPQTTILKENVKKEILSNLRAVGAFKKLTDDEVPALHRAVDFFLGFGMQAYDESQEMKWYYDREEKRRRAAERYERSKE